VDLRSDTVTKPTREMLECALSAPIGDDVMGEDPTVTELEEYAADLFGKRAGLFLPTGTMSNLCAILSHCHERASEIIIGSSSHINLYEGGNAANLGGVYTKQIPEDPLSATLDMNEVRSAHRRDNDVHYGKTALVCIENTHNILGGVALPKEHIDEMGRLANDELSVPLHVDGARIMNAAVSLGTSPSDLCAGADSISICLSKGLGAPLGSVLVGESEFIRLARRARKRCGGGMRQAGVVASMGLYALQNHVERLAEDHIRAKRLATALGAMGFQLPRDGQVDTNLVFFALPRDADISVSELCERLDQEYGVKIGGGYSRPGERKVNYIRAATNMDVDDDGIERALEGIERILSDGCR
jgi:threonine aldolase